MDEYERWEIETKDRYEEETDREEYLESIQDDLKENRR